MGSSKGTDVVYIPGNHDDAVRNYLGVTLGGIRIERDAVHTTADGRRFWVLHGDEFDHVVNGARWLSILGDRAYDAAIFADKVVNKVRRRMGKPYWTLSKNLKARVKTVTTFLGGFREKLVAAAKQRGVDGVQPAFREPQLQEGEHALREPGEVLVVGDGPPLPAGRLRQALAAVDEEQVH